MLEWTSRHEPREGSGGQKPPEPLSSKHPGFKVDIF